jgi:hypothetical protein
VWAKRLRFEALSSPLGSRERPWRTSQRCRALREFGGALVAAAQNVVEHQQGAVPERHSDGFVSPVLRGRIGPIGWSAVVVRVRHFWTVFGVSP